MKLCLSMICLVLLIALVGCGGRSTGQRQYSVSGKVTVDGKPLEIGDLSLVPSDGVGGAFGAEIVDGAFRIKTTAGPKTVRIESYRLSQTLVGPDGKPGTEQFLPARYNSKSTLTATIPDGDQVPLEFILTTKP